MRFEVKGVLPPRELGRWSRAIDVDGWRLDQYDAMVDGLIAGTPHQQCGVAELVHLG